MLEIGNPEIQNLPKNMPFIFNKLQLRTYTKKGGWYYTTDPLFFGAQSKLEVIEGQPISYQSDIAIQSSWARSPVRSVPTPTDDLRALNTSFVSFVVQKNSEKGFLESQPRDKRGQ